MKSSNKLDCEERKEEEKQIEGDKRRGVKVKNQKFTI
jgi:hypothetical protein